MGMEIMPDPQPDPSAPPDPTARTTHSKYYEIALGAVIWLTFAAIGIAFIYYASRWDN